MLAMNLGPYVANIKAVITIRKRQMKMTAATKTVSIRKSRLYLVLRGQRAPKYERIISGIRRIPTMIQAVPKEMKRVHAKLLLRSRPAGQPFLAASNQIPTTMRTRDDTAINQSKTADTTIGVGDVRHDSTSFGGLGVWDRVYVLDPELVLVLDLDPDPVGVFEPEWGGDLDDEWCFGLDPLWVFDLCSCVCVLPLEPEGPDLRCTCTCTWSAMVECALGGAALSRAVFEGAG